MLYAGASGTISASLGRSKRAQGLRRTRSPALSVKRYQPTGPALARAASEEIRFAANGAIMAKLQPARQIPGLPGLSPNQRLLS